MIIDGVTVTESYEIAVCPQCEEYGSVETEDGEWIVCPECNGSGNDLVPFLPGMDPRSNEYRRFGMCCPDEDNPYIIRDEDD